MRAVVCLGMFVVAGCVGDTAAVRAPRPASPPPPPAPGPGPAPAGSETAYLAGGCFWGMEEILRAVPGVLDTEVGMVAGAETVRVVFDPARLSYEELLYRSFFRMHDPTTRDRQGNDVGRSYRSAIFFVSEAQRRTAQAVKARVERERRWPAPIVTEITPAAEFTRAGEPHQDYLQKHPDGYSCHYLREWVI